MGSVNLKFPKFVELVNWKSSTPKYSKSGQQYQWSKSPIIFFASWLDKRAKTYRHPSQLEIILTYFSFKSWSSPVYTNEVVECLKRMNPWTLDENSKDTSISLCFAVFTERPRVQNSTTAHSYLCKSRHTASRQLTSSRKSLEANGSLGLSFILLHALYELRRCPELHFVWCLLSLEKRTEVFR